MKRLQGNFLEELKIKPVFIGNVYNPTFGDDTKNFITSFPEIGRANHLKVNKILEKLGKEFGGYVDLHNHFLKGNNLDWLTSYIEPSISGASEIRCCFLKIITQYLKDNKKII